MNCLDYRRVLLTGEGETAAMREHRLQCVFCGPLYREHEAMEAELRRALDIPAPEGFAERLSEAIAAQALVAPPQSAGRRRFLAAAAVGAGAVGLGLYAWIERIGSIRHIAPCPFGGGTAYHVVLMTPQDKVTLLVMPDTRMQAHARASHDGMYASVVPLRKGSVGVVGTNAAVVKSVVGAIRG